LPPIEPVHDPRNLYASDSPVMEDRDSDEEPGEVEQQLLPQTEPVHDPRNLYASDSPVMNDTDSDEELYKSAEEEILDVDGQGDATVNGSNPELNVCFIDLTYTCRR
jgi:hypothetical protein